MMREQRRQLSAGGPVGHGPLVLCLAKPRGARRAGDGAGSVCPTQPKGGLRGCPPPCTVSAQPRLGGQLVEIPRDQEKPRLHPEPWRGWQQAAHTVPTPAGWGRLHQPRTRSPASAAGLGLKSKTHQSAESTIRFLIREHLVGSAAGPRQPAWLGRLRLGVYFGVSQREAGTSKTPTRACPGRHHGEARGAACCGHHCSGGRDSPLPTLILPRHVPALGHQRGDQPHFEPRGCAMSPRSTGAAGAPPTHTLETSPSGAP